MRRVPCSLYFFHLFTNLISQHVLVTTLSLFKSNLVLRRVDIGIIYSSITQNSKFDRSMQIMWKRKVAGKLDLFEQAQIFAGTTTPKLTNTIFWHRCFLVKRRVPCSLYFFHLFTNLISQHVLVTTLSLFKSNLVLRRVDIGIIYSSITQNSKFDRSMQIMWKRKVAGKLDLFEQAQIFAGTTTPKLTNTIFWHRCFLVNFVKLLKISFLQNSFGLLLLYLCNVFLILKKLILVKPFNWPVWLFPK